MLSQAFEGAVLRSTLSICAVGLVGSMPFGQQGSMTVLLPGRHLELEDGFDFSVTGSGFHEETPEISVYAGVTDITSQVIITLENESMLDSNEDGLLESYTGDFHLDFDSYDDDAGLILRIEAIASAPGGSVSGDSSVEVDSHVHVYADSVQYGEADVHVSVRTTDLFVNSLGLQVFLGSTNVTSQLTITGPVTTYDDTDTNSPPFTTYRAQYYLVDVSPLGEFQERLHFVATATGSGRGSASPGSTSSTSSAVGEVPDGEEGDPCAEALEKFMDALELSGGGTGGGAVSVGATSSEVSAAAEALQTALVANNCPLSGTHTDSDGRTLKYKVGKDDAGSSKNAEASGKADVVAAVGGDVTDQSSTTGGSATATNDQPGGAAVAVGGDGGASATSGGNGGDATANAVPLNPTTQPLDGQATAVGGTGGSPPAPKIGGSGGTAHASVGGWGPTTVTGEPGEPGSGGVGGWDKIKGSEGWVGSDDP